MDVDIDILLILFIRRRLNKVQALVPRIVLKEENLKELALRLVKLVFQLVKIALKVHDMRQQ